MILQEEKRRGLPFDWSVVYVVCMYVLVYSYYDYPNGYLREDCLNGNHPSFLSFSDIANISLLL